MRFSGLLAVGLALLSLAGCSTLQVEQQQVSGKVQIAKSLFGHQCGDTGMSVDQLKTQLEEQKIQVYAQTVASDGRLYPQVCGAPDGRIAIFTIDQKQQEQSFNLGFSLYQPVNS
ncbi:hypothetical protein [Acinetobacter sp. ANC 4641]|uniref:hypothetical protein n=1 Tax=Acinetobacter sp. ANC 4641 TaxID=2529847 RepID=UPI00103C1BBF|nr:hypothetical protein [Acinetobacter sp. ANC 4641]TCB06514.1 hypothetical protein E0H78_13165 [Acinetobacter sp. ANC 4641]